MRRSTKQCRLKTMRTLLLRWTRNLFLNCDFLKLLPSAAINYIDIHEIFRAGNAGPSSLRIDFNLSESLYGNAATKKKRNVHLLYFVYPITVARRFRNIILIPYEINSIRVCKRPLRVYGSQSYYYYNSNNVIS